LFNQIKILGFVVLMASAINAVSQINSQSGTALVTTITKNEITVAEDSFALENGQPQDNDCKIITLGDKFVFGFAGQRSVDINNGAIRWESHAAAIRAYEMSTKKTSDGVAKQFAILAKDAFGKAIKVSGWQEFTHATGALPDNIANAVFASIGTRGEPDQVIVKIVYSIPKRVVDSEIKRVAPDAAHPYRVWAAGSDIGTLREFSDDRGRTFRANMELNSWHQAVARETFDNRISLFAVQLVKWEIQYTKKTDIGGNVDYMLLNSAGIADHRKPSCQKNN
jgi:hypothetical protein